MGCSASRAAQRRCACAEGCIPRHLICVALALRAVLPFTWIGSTVAADGSGYEFLGDMVLKVDKINRQVGYFGRCF